MSGDEASLHALTAFTVLVGHHGKPVVLRDIYPAEVAITTGADTQMIRAACAAIIDDLTAADVATRVARMIQPPPEPTQQERLQQALAERKRGEDA